MSLELLFLGTGTSAGVPMIGCHCRVCRSADPRDNRTRPSVLISYADPREAASPAGPTTRQFLVDTGPDMRVQMIRESIDRIDGVLYTHAHADHLFGLDDLRRFNAILEGPIDMHVDAATRETMVSMFKYIFESHKNLNQSWVPQLVMHEIEAQRPFALFGATWTPLRLMHGRQPVLGLRVDVQGGGSLAYCTDVSTVPPESMALLRGLDLLVIDGLRYNPHPTHMTVEQAIAVVNEVKPGRAYLTHIAHDILYAELEPRLPMGVHLSYDGLRVRCDVPREIAAE